MAEPIDLFGSDEDDASVDQSGNDVSELLIRLLEEAPRLLVKKLSNNDRDWAQRKNKHQGGVYIPLEQRDGGFFPPLGLKERDEDGEPIYEAFLTTEWPQVGETKKSRLVNYTSKGEETHMTRVPRAAFADLSPASFLVMARLGEGENTVYRCLTVDSVSDAAVMLVDALELGPDFLIDERVPAEYRKRERDRILTFAEQVAAAWLSGTIAVFAAEKVMPETLALADEARGKWLTKTGRKNLNPFEFDTPGDALRDISRSIEWDLFREYQLRERAVGLVRIVLGDVPGGPKISKVIHALVDRLPEIDRYMLSAGQQRKARAGVSFEHHIEKMLADGRVPFAKQAVMQARKRPDFVLPSLGHLKSTPSGREKGLILSAKTTLRERWKQVEREMQGAELFLGTVDENIAANAIEEMATMGINLVVPEHLKKSKETEYDRHKNVLSFKTFFDTVVSKRMAGW
ncbi:type II restriction endonuclease [Bradyrhizobium tropiciagri]|uniref:type II restriction endonuclease n=1 Tax=Bradyrhizobium tropiciagri TaxID=312253 RepID=UPI000B23B371|nr:type II restriction endonuclease [Bradyrhizobium tropiciagri]